MRIVLDTSILVRATEGSQGVARELLRTVISQKHTLLLANEILWELAKVLRYPRLQSIHGLSEPQIYDYIRYLREVSEAVIVNPLLTIPIRDVNDIFVVQTAVVGTADVVCTNDADFYDAAVTSFLTKLGIRVLNDIELLKIIRP